MRYGYGRPLYLVAPPRKVPPGVDAHPNVGLEGKGVDGAGVDRLDGGLRLEKGGKRTFKDLFWCAVKTPICQAFKGAQAYEMEEAVV